MNTNATEPIAVRNLRELRLDRPDAQLVQREGWWIIAEHGQVYGGPEEGGWYHERWSTLCAVRGSRHYAAFTWQDGEPAELPMDNDAKGELELPPDVAAIEAMMRERSQYPDDIWTHWCGDDQQTEGEEPKAPCGGGTFGGYE